jgi:hypothetical protein
VIAHHLEEGDAHLRDGTFVAGEVLEVVVHNVTAADTEDPDVAQPGDQLLHIGHRLLPQPLHLLLVLGLRVGEHQERVSIIGTTQALQLEDHFHFVVRVGADRPVAAGRARRAHRDRVAGRHAHLQERPVGGGHQLEGAVARRAHDVQAVAHRDAADPGAASRCERRVGVGDEPRR